MILRQYQQQASDAVVEIFLKGIRSTLIVQPTGTGKTVEFVDIAGRVSKKRTLLLAHRRELVQQAAERFHAVTGMWPETEMASQRGGNGPMASGVLVASVQSMASRYKRYAPDAFDLIIVDEAHHALASSYRRVLNYFTAAPTTRLLGVTATPKRSDDKALGQVFESVAYELTMLEAMKQGWLCPIRSHVVRSVEMDFSGLHTAAGDFEPGELSAIMSAEQPVHKVASTTAEVAAGRKSIVFCVTVEHARLVQEVLVRYGVKAALVTGKTPTKEREDVLSKYRSGEVTSLINCGVFTEGFDAPDTSVIVLARPTKSVGLFTQMVGRGLRPLPGVVDSGHDGLDRSLRIAGSAKPLCDVIDFTGTAGRHKLVRCVDILGGKWNEQVRAKVTARIDDGEAVNVIEALDEETRQMNEAVREANRRKLSRVVGKPIYALDKLNPMGPGHDPVHDNHARYTGNLATDAQVQALRRFGYPIDGGMTKKRAGQVLSMLAKQRLARPPSERQQIVLRRHGMTASTAKEASVLIEQLKRNGWKRVTA